MPVSEPSLEMFAPEQMDPGILSVLWLGLNEASGAWVLVVRDDGVIVHVNESLRSALGRPRDLIMGRPASEVLQPSIAAERAEHYIRVAREQRPVCLEGFVGGSLVRCNLLPVPAAQAGGHSYTICVSRPIGPDAAPGSLPRVRTRCDDLGVLGTLSEREIDVLRLIGRGMTTAQIARELHRSVKTIEWHRVSLGSKLGVSNRVDLARLAIRFGLATSALDLPPAGNGVLSTDAPK